MVHGVTHRAGQPNQDGLRRPHHRRGRRTPGKRQTGARSGLRGPLSTAAGSSSRVASDQTAVRRHHRYPLAAGQGRAPLLQDHGCRLPRLAGHAVLREHVQRPGPAAPRRQRPLRRARLDVGARCTRGASGHAARGRICGDKAGNASSSVAQRRSNRSQPSTATTSASPSLPAKRVMALAAAMQTPQPGPGRGRLPPGP
jgi:hypothetical protein